MTRRMIATASALLSCAGIAAAQTAGAPLGTKPVPSTIPAPAGPAKPPQMPPAAVNPALGARIDQVVGVLNGTVDYDGYFALAFKTAVPKDKFEPVRAQLIAGAGKALKVTAITITGEWQADVIVACEKTAITLRIAIDPADPHQVTGLAVTGFTAAQSTPKAVIEGVAALPGTTSFGFFKLGDGAPMLVAGHNATTPLAIGSAFKLVVLAELVRTINAQQRNWADTVTIDGTPLPGGAYTVATVGTKVALSELATKMIQVSDNSATDLLIRALGRDKVEAMLPVVGVAPSPRNRPWLTTLEMFKLKGVAGLAQQYLALGDDAQRKLLDGPVAALPLSAISPNLFKNGKPVLIDRLEWFESPADVANVYDWLCKHTAPGTLANPARAILAGNPGLPPAVAAQWQFVGYKGGSEPGVLAMTYLLQGKDGQWYVLATAWNNPAQSVDTGTLGGLAAKYASLVAPKP